MPPDPVGQLERSRARRPPLLGARPLLGRCAPCAAPMPPDQPPRGSRRARLERSRARPPPLFLPGGHLLLGPSPPCGPTPARPPPPAPAQPPPGARPPPPHPPA